MSIQFYEQRELIARFTKDLYDRRLTDTSGGNVSIRVGDVVLMTPSLSGTLFHWNLKPEQILVYDAKGNKLEGEGTLSREAKVHFSLYDAYYPEGTAVVHAHSLNVLVFCAAVQPMPPVRPAPPATNAPHTSCCSSSFTSSLNLGGDMLSLIKSTEPDH